MQMTLDSLSPTQLEALCRQLVSREHVLREEIEQRLHAEDRDVAQIERDAAELNDVELALERVQAGSYGICVDCGEPIAWKRLDAVPHAVRCLDCEALLESRQPPGNPFGR